jgi:hypothetical protein
VKRSGQFAVFALCVLFSVSAAYNVMSDNYAIEQDAKSVACRDEGDKCTAQVTRMERTPFAQSFEITTTKREVGVKCVRSLIMVGDYACTLR